MDISCPYCGRALPAAEVADGHPVQCPGCQMTFPVPAASEKVGAPPPSAADDYFAGLPPDAPAPAILGLRGDEAARQEAIRPSRRPTVQAAGSAEAEERVRGPATALMLLSGVGLAAALLGPFLSLAKQATSLGKGPESAPAEEFLFACLVSLLLGAYCGYIFWAARQMKRLKGYGHAVAAGVLATAPFFTPCCVVGVPVGLWALHVLSEPGVKGAFT